MVITKSIYRAWQPLLDEGGFSQARIFSRLKQNGHNTTFERHLAINGKKISWLEGYWVAFLEWSPGNSIPQLPRKF